MANNDAALSHFEAAAATLRNNSAAGFPESNIYQTLQRLDAGIALMKGEEAKPIQEPITPNTFPQPKNRGDVPKPAVVVKPAGQRDGGEGAKKPVSAPKGYVAKYADGFTDEKADRSKFADKSPGGAKRISIEPKK